MNSSEIDRVIQIERQREKEIEKSQVIIEENERPRISRQNAK